MSRKLRKPPSYLRKPWFASKIIEIGAGQLPYQGVTHIVDKYPESNEQRGEDLFVPQGMKFFAGEMEALPFPAGERFDYLYARHIFEHVLDPEKSVKEINRVSNRGYIETPSPFYEMICCSFPFNPKDMHTLFVWANPRKNELYVIKKSAKMIENFCTCQNGHLARRITEFKRSKRGPVEDGWFPNSTKTTKLFFRGPIVLKIYSDFKTPCSEGHCAFSCLEAVRLWSAWPIALFRKKSNQLKQLLNNLD